MNKDTIFQSILNAEGGYTNHPADKGGPTNFGITQATALAHGYTGDMRALTRSQALAIYESDYWYGPRFDLVADVSPAIAAELCDTGVNMGPSVPARWLQRWLTALNDGGKLYPDLKVDGQIGPRTINALKAYLAKRGGEAETILLRALNCTQGNRYLELAESRPQNEAFLYGWLKRV